MGIEVKRENVFSRFVAEPRCLWIAIIYVFCALGNVRAKVMVTREPYRYLASGEHRDLVAGEGLAPAQYRVLTYIVPEELSRVLPIGPLDGYMIQRVVYTVLSFLVFHIYLRAWFSTAGAMLGVIFLSTAMQWTYLPHVQESDPLNLFLFILGFFAIHERRFPLLFVVVLIGSLNKLTIAFLPFVYFVTQLRRKNVARVIGRAALLLSLIGAICGTIRWHFAESRYITEVAQWSENLDGIADSVRASFPFRPYLPDHLGVLFLFGPVWVLALLHLREKPAFLRRSLWLLPPFLLGHFMIAKINEIRVFLPLACVLVPLAWHELPFLRPARKT